MFYSKYIHRVYKNKEDQQQEKKESSKKISVDKFEIGKNLLFDKNRNSIENDKNSQKKNTISNNGTELSAKSSSKFYQRLKNNIKFDEKKPEEKIKSIEKKYLKIDTSKYSNMQKVETKQKFKEGKNINKNFYNKNEFYRTNTNYNINNEKEIGKTPPAIYKKKFHFSSNNKEIIIKKRNKELPNCVNKTETNFNNTIIEKSLTITSRNFRKMIDPKVEEKEINKTLQTNSKESMKTYRSFRKK